MRLRIASAIIAVGLVAGPAGAEIVDNSFFIEEAYNQESGIVQHIQTLHWTWDDKGFASDDGFSYAFTQEWPIGGQQNQLSYTVPYERRWGNGGRADGLGDVQLHYRRQLVEENATRPAFTPRISVLLPTGDESEDLGAGTAGFQVNLPLSKRLERLHVHLNAGATLVPGATRRLSAATESPKRSLFSPHFGFSAIGLVSDRLNLLVEALSTVEEGIDDFGTEVESTALLVSPGARYGIDRKDGGQWVLGLAAPIGVNESEDDFGLFLYLSFEHPF